MFYKLNLLDLERELPILKSPSGVYIAGFNCVGDMEMLVKSGKYLANKIEEEKIDFDIILTVEVKGIPIAQEIARNLKCDYISLRKECKCYLLNPKHISGSSITSDKSDYYVSLPDLEKIRNKRVLFVDDVFSTGSTLESMVKFSESEGFKIVGGLSILKEESNGDANLDFEFKGIKIYTCGYLPLPKNIDNENEVK